MIYTFIPERMGIYHNPKRKSINDIQKEIAAKYQVDIKNVVICNLNLFNWENWTGAAYTRADHKVVGTDGCGYFGFGFNADSKKFTRAWSSENNQANFFGCNDVIVGGELQNKPTPIYSADLKRRTVIGMMKDGKIGIYCNTVPEYPEAMKRNVLAAGFVEAVNVDGGGSTQLICPDGVVVSSDGPAGRAVHTLFWAILVKPETQKQEPKKQECPYKEPKNYTQTLYGEGAKWMQWQLNRLGAKIDIDGAFGSKSFAALIDVLSTKE